MITRRQLATAGLLTLMLSACSKPKSKPEPGALPTPSAAPGASSSQSSDAGGEEDDTFAPASTDKASRRDAAEQAEATLRALWKTDQSQEDWYAGLAKTMTDEGAAPYEYTQVENVQPAKIKGKASVEFVDEGNTAQVTVPSTQGDWMLTLYRDGDAWKTTSIRFPKDADQ